MMMKKYASLLFALFLALSLSVSAAADSSGVYVYDDAALLTQEEYDTLTASAMAVADQYGCGVYVVTVDDMADYIDPDAVTETGETGMAAFTEYAWDALGLAASYDSNGIMLALSSAQRIRFMGDVFLSGIQNFPPECEKPPELTVVPPEKLGPLSWSSDSVLMGVRTSVVWVKRSSRAVISAPPETV